MAHGIAHRPASPPVRRVRHRRRRRTRTVQLLGVQATATISQTMPGFTQAGVWVAAANTATITGTVSFFQAGIAET